MSFLTRPTVVCAIVFGCFAVLIPRVFVPLFRPRTVSTSHRVDDNFRRPPSPMSRSEPDDTIEHLSGSPPHKRGAHPNMRMNHPGAVGQQQQPLTDQTSAKSIVTFALPMYTVGIGIFFLYTCVKYWSKQNTEENKIKHRYSSNNIQWNADKKKFKYDINNRPVEDEEENEEDLYTGLDPDYVEYLKLKRRKELETEQALTSEQRQMHNALDEMKKSLSFISTKLVANQTQSSLSNNDISQLQDRLASTESQMCQILQALDAASNKVSELTKNPRQSLEQPQKTKEENHHASRSASESDDSLNNEEENSDSDENSSNHEEQALLDNKQEESASSSYDEEEEEPNQMEDDESESESSERYGIMTTNYECDPATIEDYTLNKINKSEQPDNSQTKVHEWHQRNHSQSLSSSNSSIEQDQAIPNIEQNRLRKRKH